MLAFILIFTIITFLDLPNILNNNRFLENYYINNGVKDTGAINQVTAILLDYRAFDTLGEAIVIFTAASIIGYFAPKKKAPMLGVRLDVLVRYGVALILPFLLVFGLYIILYGHLSPGGGFTGGVVLASIVIIYNITFGFGRERVYLFKQDTKKKIENIGLLTFLTIGLIGVLTEGSFLANNDWLISIGKSGNLFSGGWIPLLNLVSGLKVGSGLAIIFNKLIKED